MTTPHNKQFSEETILRIEGPNVFEDKSYPLPSKFYLDIHCENFSYRFGYNDIKDAEEDKEFLEKLICR